ncbi:MAG TPA: RluA family pseudouridine synthase [Gemmataceae bacterium]|nr:RluA family pseudouridine synthase [Gemmataceae bacterium]
MRATIPAVYRLPLRWYNPSLMASRSFVVSRARAGQTVAALLRRHLGISSSEARRLVQERRVRLAGKPCLNPTWRAAAGQRIDVETPTRGQPRQKGTEPIIRFADEQVVVVEKPPGLTTMRHPEEAAEFGARARRFLPPTLADLLPNLLAEHAGPRRGRPVPVFAVHRIDKETSGLVVFARTRLAVKHLGRQFREHTIERRYLALVRGQAKDQRIESWLVRDRGDGRRGSSGQPGVGQRAVTHVKVVEQLGDYTLVECRLETGRTHQVRIHLAEAGTPLCGERVYDRPLHGKPLPDDSGAPRVALHAAFLAFDHPTTGKRMKWTSPLPPDLAAVAARLRARLKADHQPR